MKIGILTMHRVYNFGSFLQSYSLKKTIENMGHECFFIDIKPGINLFIEEKKQKRSISFYLKKFDKYFFKRIAHYIFLRKMKKIFKDNLKNELGVSNYVFDKHCDIVLIGSDEVFNCVNRSPWGFSKQLFGDNLNCKKVISYAASFGHTKYEDLVKFSLIDDLKIYFKNFSSLSLRDKNSLEIVNKVADIKGDRNVDPVLIYNYSKEIKLNNKINNYILVYAYDNRISNKNDIKNIKNFAKSKGKKLLSVGMYQVWCDYNIIANSFELLGYFKNADYVITDTFHGTVLSIKYNKQFITFIRNSNSNKLLDLLKYFGLEDRQVLNSSLISKNIDKIIDYEKINDIIKEERKRSLNYLRKNLKMKVIKEKEQC